MRMQRHIGRRRRQRHRGFSKTLPCGISNQRVCRAKTESSFQKSPNNSMHLRNAYSWMCRTKFERLPFTSSVPFQSPVIGKFSVVFFPASTSDFDRVHFRIAVLPLSM